MFIIFTSVYINKIIIFFSKKLYIALEAQSGRAEH